MPLISVLQGFRLERVIVCAGKFDRIKNTTVARTVQSSCQKTGESTRPASDIGRNRQARLDRIADTLNDEERYRPTQFAAMLTALSEPVTESEVSDE